MLHVSSDAVRGPRFYAIRLLFILDILHKAKFNCMTLTYTEIICKNISPSRLISNLQIYQKKSPMSRVEMCKYVNILVVHHFS